VFQSLANNLLFDFLRNLVPEGSGLGLFGAQALHAIFQLPAIPVIESTTMDAQFFQSLADRKLRILYNPNDLHLF
jgi:hypothetical protein